ncbi:HNH endonuclease [Pseudooceanicola nitratireducens]|uniref:HNH endonuclease n=1 Tax=Pseudooceanicola nitratireducens TaxID=517719 RepID=UPI001C960F44|nr:HNH endonuclease [Pseudooceanicola nitratireducens]MBY6164852.1 HNH endonuclease [Pseudooceanicola nitratireducens]
MTYDISQAAFIDTTIHNDAGKALYFSWPDFVERICGGQGCFICGRTRNEVAFNDEHIVPNWVLHAFGLHGQKITLPNGNPTLYGNYKIPCCEACNTEMSRVFEQDMACLVKEGGNSLQDHVAAGGGLLPYTWMALIFLKLHLNDRRLRQHLDRRKGDAPISDGYVWEDMHHLHAVARAFHIGAEVLPEAIGSMFIFPIRGGEGDFDLLTFTDAQTLYLQLGTTGLIAVFDDACAAINRVGWILEKISGPISPVQGRELSAHFALANIELINRPRFWTHISNDRKKVMIGGAHDAVPTFRKLEHELFGSIMASVFSTPPAVIGKTAEEVAAGIATGEISFLFDCKGDFINDQAGTSGGPGAAKR